MQKQMIVTLPEEFFECSEVYNSVLSDVAKACSGFLKGEQDVLLLPDSFSYEINEVDSDISEVVVTFDREED